MLARSAKRFTEEFVGRKLQKHEGVQLGGACFELGLIKAKISDSENEKSPGNIYVTLSESGQEFVSYKNQLIDFVYKNIQNEPSSIFSQQERQFYLKKILPKFNFENKLTESQFYKVLNKASNNDTNLIHTYKNWNNLEKKEFEIDTVLRTYSKLSNSYNDTLWRNLPSVIQFPDFIYTDRTMQQLENSGGMRFILNKDALNAIIDYDLSVKHLLESYIPDLNFYYQNSNQMWFEIMDIEDYETDLKKMSVQEMEKGNNCQLIRRTIPHRI